MKRPTGLVYLIALIIGLIMFVQVAVGSSLQGSPAVVLAAEENAGRIFLPIVTSHSTTSTTSPINSSVYGMDFGPIAYSRGISELSEAGVTWARRGGFSWAEIEPQEGVRNWSALADFEQELITAADEGFEVVLPVAGTPSWAQMYSSGCGPIKPEKLPAFAKFMHDLVARYSQPPFSVKYWEIWNEPDIAVFQSSILYGCWGDPNDPYYGGEYYAEMLKHVYPAIKSVDQSAQVLVGGLLLDCNPLDPPPHKDCKPSLYLEGILVNGGKQYFDGISFHSYDHYWHRLDLFGNGNWHTGSDTKSSSIGAKAEYLRKMLAKYGVENKYLMSTENALLCDGDCGEIYEQTKAHYVAQTYAETAALGLRTNIWYNSLGTWRNAGLLYSDLTPRPAYFAYQFSSKELMNAEFVREISEYEGVKVLEFERPDRRIWILYSWSGQTNPVNLPDIPLAMYDTFGNPQEPSATVSVSPAPIYVEWSR